MVCHHNHLKHHDDHQSATTEAVCIGNQDMIIITINFTIITIITMVTIITITIRVRLRRQCGLEIRTWSSPSSLSLPPQAVNLIRY